MYQRRSCLIISSVNAINVPAFPLAGSNLSNVLGATPVDESFPQFIFNPFMFHFEGVESIAKHVDMIFFGGMYKLVLQAEQRFKV